MHRFGGEWIITSHHATPLSIPRSSLEHDDCFDFPDWLTVLRETPFEFNHFTLELNCKASTVNRPVHTSYRNRDQEKAEYLVGKPHPLIIEFPQGFVGMFCPISLVSQIFGIEQQIGYIECPLRYQDNSNRVQFQTIRSLNMNHETESHIPLEIEKQIDAACDEFEKNFDLVRIRRLKITLKGFRQVIASIS